ncbi:MAG: N-acetylmuramidase domain-containing protein [Rhizobiaceae bacterium]
MNRELWDAVKESSERLNVEPAALMAVVEIESAGKYYASVDGKPEPLIRFEGHYFDRRITGSTRARARLRGVSSPLAGAVKNPAAQKDRWVLLSKAIALNRAAALESTSWGIGQVMGAHWKWLGYDSVEELVETARSGLNGQVELMVRYIDKSGLAAALRAQNWHAFGRGYNGPNYAKLGYHFKLAEAYAKTSSGPAPTVIEDHAAPQADILRRGNRGARVKELQRQLTALGYVVDADGTFGKATETALKQFQSTNAIPADGIAGIETEIAIAKKLPDFRVGQWLWNLIKSLASRLF